jgi:hypothetical protein
MNGCPVEHSKSKNQARGKDDIASGFSTGVVVVVVVVAYIVILCWGRLLELSSSIDLLIVIFTTALLGTIVWDNKLNVFNIKCDKTSHQSYYEKSFTFGLAVIRFVTELNLLIKRIKKLNSFENQAKMFHVNCGYIQYSRIDVLHHCFQQYLSNGSKILMHLSLISYELDSR